MALKLIKRKGLDDHTLVAVWEEGKGFVERVKDHPFLDDDVYAEYSEEMMFEEFDGPDIFAVRPNAQKTLGDTLEGGLQKEGWR